VSQKIKFKLSLSLKYQNKFYCRKAGAVSGIDKRAITHYNFSKYKS
jgi:hypothetical protein